MKLFLTLIVSAIILAGCHKDGEVTPKSNPNNSTGTQSGNSTGGSSSTPPDSTVKYTHDDSIHFATFRMAPQNVKTSVTGSKLTLVFNENVDLLFTVAAYKLTSAVHLHEDFSASQLAGFDFTTVAEGGNTTFDWVDDNLNNVMLKKVTDTMINNKPWVKINVQRPFTFSKQYASNDAALNEQAAFLANTNDVVLFSSYCYYNQKNYPSVTAAASLVYTK